MSVWLSPLLMMAPTLLGSVGVPLETTPSDAYMMPASAAHPGHTPMRWQRTSGTSSATGVCPANATRCFTCSQSASSPTTSTSCPTSAALELDRCVIRAPSATVGHT